MHIWDIAIEAPTGSINATLKIDTSFAPIKGHMNGKGGSGPMEKLVFDGGKIAWSTKIQKPMPMTLSFRGNIEDDTITGNVKFGIFASGTFLGTQRT